MRRVKVKNHGIYNKEENKWHYNNEVFGVFHAWGQYSQELRDGVSTDSAAIVELPNGEIIMPSPTNVIFLEPTTMEQE